MSKRKISRIAPVAATAPSSPVSIYQTNSILTDPDGRWVAARQSAITAGLEQRGKAKAVERTVERTGEKLRFSGENERIGTWVSDEKDTFGTRSGYL
jgi:hypothetical protein